MLFRENPSTSHCVVLEGCSSDFSLGQPQVRSEPTARLEAALPSPEVPEGQSDGKTQGEGEVISEKEDGTADAGQVARPDVPDAKGASEEHPSEATQPDETGDQSGRRSSVPTTAEESGSPEILSCFWLGPQLSTYSFWGTCVSSHPQKVIRLSRESPQTWWVNADQSCPPIA